MQRPLISWNNPYLVMTPYSLIQSEMMEASVLKTGYSQPPLSWNFWPIADS